MARPSYPSDNVDKLLLRFPFGMRDLLKAMAEANSRSLNAEIIERLKESFHDEATDREDQLAKKIDELSDTIRGLSALIESRLPASESERDADKLMAEIESLKEGSK